MRVVNNKKEKVLKARASWLCVDTPLFECALALRPPHVLAGAQDVLHGTPPLLPSYIVAAAVAPQTSPAKRSHNVSRPALGWILQPSMAALEASIDAAWHQRRQQNKEPHLRDAHLPCKKEERGVCNSFCAPVTIPKNLVKKDIYSKMELLSCGSAHVLVGDNPLRY